MDATEVIEKCENEAQLEFLVIGGLAVIAYGYSRDTVDLDYLVRRSKRLEWTESLGRYGYKVYHEQQNFAQFTLEGSVDLDLMFVNEQTFEKLWAASEFKRVGAVPVRFPALDHLVALKLHVIKQDIAHRNIRDMDDVIHLLKVNHVNLSEQRWREVFERHGTKQLYDRLTGSNAA